MMSVYRYSVVLSVEVHKYSEDRLGIVVLLILFGIAVGRLSVVVTFRSA